MYWSLWPVSIRSRLYFLAALFVAGALALLAYPQPAQACSCADPGSPSEAMEWADMVFTGQVSSMTGNPKSPVILSSADLVTVAFQVSQVWKGPQSELLTVRTEWSEVSCGYEFEEGGKYIVYARDGHTGFCTRTAPTWRAVVDFAVLGEGWRPGMPTERSGGETAGESGRGLGCTAPVSADALDGTFLLLLGIVAGLVIGRHRHK